MSAEMRPGTKLKIPCTTQNGAFRDEYLITVETADGVISGFIEAGFVTEDDAGKKYIVGTVQEVGQDTVVVRVPGSFFTTTGIAYFSQQMVESYP